MMSNLKERFERSCRLCAQEQDVTLLIFSAEAEAMLLQKKLNNYLLIEVDEDDKLPKNICIQCCMKLQTVCDFIDTARKSQEILLNRSIELDQFEPSAQYEDHHIITPNNNTPNNSVLECATEEESKITSMEISIDPMVILQNNEEILSPHLDNTCQSSNEDVSHLHGLDGENVTIKLIKKGNTDKAEKTCNANFDSYTCGICTQNFQTQYGLKHHYKTHKVEEINRQDYTCSVCNEEFVYKSRLIQHLKIHKTSRICQICGRLFRSAEKLKIHMNVHTKESLYTCKTCGRSYDTLSNLRTHSVTHCDDRPYECQLCPKTFKRNQDLKFHINQHTGAKPYKCPFCDKAFASSGNCYSHRSRMHPGRNVQKIDIRKKPQEMETEQYSPSHPRAIASKPTHAKVSPTKPVKFKCHLCGHTFMKRDNFTYHMYQHTGEKPFHCSFCSEQFVTRKGLLIHHDVKHPTKTRPLALLSRNVLLM